MSVLEVLQFGNPVRTVRKPGLHWKIPWPIEQVHPIDMRYRYFNTPLTTTFTRDRKNVVLLSYVVWHVEDPLLFFQSLGTAKAAEQKLGDLFGLRRAATFKRGLCTHTRRCQYQANNRAR